MTPPHCPGLTYVSKNVRCFAITFSPNSRLEQNTAWQHILSTEARSAGLISPTRSSTGSSPSCARACSKQRQDVPHQNNQTRATHMTMSSSQISRTIDAVLIYRILLPNDPQPSAAFVNRNIKAGPYNCNLSARRRNSFCTSNQSHLGFYEPVIPRFYAWLSRV